MMYVPASSIIRINSFAVGPALNDNRFGSSSEDLFLLTSELNKYKSRSPEPDAGSSTIKNNARLIYRELVKILSAIARPVREIHTQYRIV